MPRQFQEIEQAGLFVMQEDGTLDNVSDRVGAGYIVYDLERLLRRTDNIRPGDTFYVASPGRYWGGQFASFHLNKGEAFAVAQERYMSYIVDVVSNRNINVPNFQFPPIEEYDDEDEDGDEYDSDECTDPQCECHYEEDDDDEDPWVS